MRPDVALRNTARLELRPVASGDLPFLIALFADPGMTAHRPTRGLTRPRRSRRGWRRTCGNGRRAAMAAGWRWRRGGLSGRSACPRARGWRR